jgi:tetratricopeptide (TPR) repeat protein
MTNVSFTNAVYAAPYIDRGIARLRRNEFVAAILDFDTALAYVPDNPYAHWNKATALLSLGDYSEGFKEHEWGWRLFNWRGFGPVKDDIDRLQDLPVWNGLAPSRLLLYHELGWGDAIMVFRFLPALKQRAGSITLVIDESLATLARRFDIEVVAKVPKSLNRFDSRLPFFSAMNVLGATVENIPREPYIAANWRRTGGKIGIAWAGRTQNMFSTSTFVSLLNIEGFDLYALHPGTYEHGVHPLDAIDFSGTVKVIEQMDHIVSVDTATAHLAGAMGHPSTHVILPFMSDWRWWGASAWYPTIKTYRQARTGNDWDLPFTRVRKALTTKQGS